MKKTFKLEIVHQHPIMLTENGDRFVLDTGSPMTFGKRELEICGRRYSTGKRMLLAMICSLSGLDVDGLVGMDVLRDWNICFDYRAGTVEFSDSPFEYEGTTVRLQELIYNTIGMKAIVNGEEVQCVFDSGAKVSYTQPRMVSSMTQTGTADDFYPGMGRFTVPTYTMNLNIAGKDVPAVCGILPQDSMMGKLMASQDWTVIGYDLLANNRVALNLSRNEMIIS